MANPSTEPAPSEAGAPDVDTATTDWGAAVWAGVAAGLVFIVLETTMVWLFMGQSPGAPVRMIAAMLLGPEVLPPQPDYSMTPMVAAMLVHASLSVIYGPMIGWTIHRMGRSMAVLSGIAFALVAIYAVNFYLIAPSFFPWFVEARNAINIFAHAVFGAVAAAVYIGLRRPGG
jgi:hypothetical protein